MASLNVSLPSAMKEWIEAQTRSGQYGNASEYVRDLVRRDQNDRAALERLQAAIDHGRQSGISDRSADEIRAAARAELTNEG